MFQFRTVQFSSSHNVLRKLITVEKAKDFEISDTLPGRSDPF
jgi:hypothetical protein